jgi:hypothetical protein
MKIDSTINSTINSTKTPVLNRVQSVPANLANQNKPIIRPANKRSLTEPPRLSSVTAYAEIKEIMEKAAEKFGLTTPVDASHIDPEARLAWLVKNATRVNSMDSTSSQTTNSSKG